MPGRILVWMRCQWCGKLFQGREDQARRGRVKFCSRYCANKNISVNRKNHKLFGEKNANWKGGITYHTKGYVYRYAPDHPRQSNGYVFEHILVAEKMLGRYLDSEEVVHHKNHKKDDNRPGNIQVFESNSAHTKYHAEERRKSKAS